MNRDSSVSDIPAFLTRPGRNIEPALIRSRSFNAADLSDAQQLAVLARALYEIGYDDHMAGHITARRPDGNLLCNPWGVRWADVRASDIITIDLAGDLVCGDWPVPPGIPLHVALHAARPDVQLAVHNHPRYSGIWAAAGRLPGLFDQTSALTNARVALVEEYRGEVSQGDLATAAVRAMGSAEIALLAGHGIFVLADTAERVYRRCYSFEWRARRAWEVAAVGGGVPLAPDVSASFGQRIEEDGFPGYWEAAIRSVVARDSTVLD